MYESYYGLNSKPFQLTPDPEFFFASKLHKRAMSYLQYGLSQAEGFIVITGDIGTGKTTIANSLLNNIEADIHAAQIVTPRLSPDEIVKMVTAKFGIDTTGKSKTDLLQALQYFLEELARTGKRALLLVDEAQNLPLETIEELRMLSNFQKSGKPLLQSFLLGQPELQPILRAPDMEQFRQRIVASCHLAPLNYDETCAYINYRLEHAGCTKPNLFTDDAYKAIHKFTTGVPRKVNTLMDRVLLYGFLEELESFDLQHVSQVIEEVQEEMFVPDDVMAADPDEILIASQRAAQAAARQAPVAPVTSQVLPTASHAGFAPSMAQPSAEPLAFATPEPVAQLVVTPPQPAFASPQPSSAPLELAAVEPSASQPSYTAPAPQASAPAPSISEPVQLTTQPSAHVASSYTVDSSQLQDTSGVASAVADAINTTTPLAQQGAPGVAAEQAAQHNANASVAGAAYQPQPVATERPVHVTKNGNVVHEAQYYKEMLEDLVDALDDAIKNKVKLTQYIDKLLKKKYQTNVRLKSEDNE